MKLYSDFALHNEYLIRIRAQAQAPYHIEENTYETFGGAPSRIQTEFRAE